MGSRVKQRLATGTQRLSLRWVLVVPFVLQVAGVVGLVGWLSFRNGQQAVADLADRLGREASDRVRQHLESYLSAPVLVGRLNTDAFRLGQLSAEDLEGLQRHFWRQAQLFDTVRYLYFSDNDGQFVGVGRNADGTFDIGAVETETGLTNFYTYAGYRKGERGQVLSVDPGFNARERPWYRAAVREGQPTWSPIYTRSAPYDPGASLDAVRPIYDITGNTVGVLGASLQLDDFDRFLQGLSVGKSGQVFAVETSGLLVATSTEEGSVRVPTLNQPPQRFLATYSRNPLTRATARHLIERFGGFDRLQNPKTLEFAIDDSDGDRWRQWLAGRWFEGRYFASVVPFRDRYGLEWVVVAVVPQADFLDAIAATTRTTVALCAGALVVAIAVGSATAAWITRPILQLGEAARAIASGDFDREVRSPGTRELALLESSFNDMAAQLRQSFHALETANLQLEQRVWQRTQALSQSEAKFAKAFHASPDAITLSALQDGRFIEVNDRFLNLFGYDLDEVLGHTSLDLNLWVDSEDRQTLVRALQAQEPTRQLEFQGRTKSGEIRTLLVSGEMVEIDDEPCALLVIHDITERKRVQENLAKSLALQAATFESIADGILAVDSDGNVTSYNRRFLEMWRLSETFLNLPSKEERLAVLAAQTADPGGFVRCILDLYEQPEAETQEIVELRDGRAFDRRSRPQRVGDEIVGRVWTFRDITERKRAEEALRRAEEKYRSIVENAAEGIFQVSPEGRYLSANPALARIYGYGSPGELVLRLTDVARQLYLAPQRRRDFLSEIAASGSVSNFESQVRRADGTTIWISENVHEVRDEAGKLLYYEGTVEDITKRKAAEEALQAEKAKSEQLLLNILPQPIAELLKRDRRPIAQHFEEATILFADIVGFTPFSATMPPGTLVGWLNRIFSTFDSLAEQHELEKIKTIGDAYMVAAGLPVARDDHADAIAQMALDMQAAIAKFPRNEAQPLQLRIGIHTGPVVAGVIGTSKFIYDLWGDTVNVASRMESQGEPGRIQTTATTYDRLKDRYEFQPRGAISVKGRGFMSTYWLVGRQTIVALPGGPPPRSSGPGGGDTCDLPVDGRCVRDASPLENRPRDDAPDRASG